MYPVRKMVAGGALAAAALTGGALGATLFGSADAATTSSTSSSSVSTPSHQGGHHANGKTETLLTGTTKTKAVAAARAAVPGATVERAETDAEGAVYEVHMTKADGSDVTVKLDANFKVTGTVTGRG